jgi:hypothetical protein
MAKARRSYKKRRRKVDDELVGRLVEEKEG